MAKAKAAPARVRARVAFRCLAYSLATVWLLPALLFNLDWTGANGWAHNTGAVLSILAAAGFIEGSRRCGKLGLSLTFVLAALFLVYVNAKVAFETLSTLSEGRR